MLNKSRTTRGVSALVAVALGVTLTAVSMPAFAAASVSPVASPTTVEYSEASLNGATGAGGMLLIVVAGVAYYGAKSALGTGCSAYNQTVDTLKVWSSMAQAALLSGKSVKLYYFTCGSNNFIQTMDLNQ